MRQVTDKKLFLRLKRHLLQDPVLVISFVLALCSSFFVMPSKAYLDYIDWRVLALLLSLMLVVAGLRKAGLFLALIDCFLKKIHTTRVLAFVLVMLCFFSSMLITNDIALITFVPLTILLLEETGKGRQMIEFIVLETVAANLGSMLTPIGNPQNLYLYSLSGMTLQRFFSLMYIPALCALLLLSLSVRLLIRTEPLPDHLSAQTVKPERRSCICLFLLFILCLLTVAHILHYGITLCIVLLYILTTDRKLLGAADYGLLFTFCFFFVFVGNLQNISALNDVLSGLIGGREMTMGILLSQVISNVPAAMFLSGFSSRYPELLLGVNLGGLGTLIASMASLISYKAYSGCSTARRGRYIIVFTAYNFLFLALLWGAVHLLLPSLIA